MKRAKSARRPGTSVLEIGGLRMMRMHSFCILIRREA